MALDLQQVGSNISHLRDQPWLYVCEIGTECKTVRMGPSLIYRFRGGAATDYCVLLEPPNCSLGERKAELLWSGKTIDEV